MPRYLLSLQIADSARSRGSIANLTQIRIRDRVLGRKAVSQDFQQGVSRYGTTTRLPNGVEYLCRYEVKGSSGHVSTAAKNYRLSRGSQDRFEPLNKRYFKKFLLTV